MTSTTLLPHSAISSWGGFLYQGKIALYHSIKLIIDESFGAKKVEQFDLQLDSTDDFAIYHNGIAISTHQVKAKGSAYRSSYADALKQASDVIMDCDQDTVRHFHISQELDDMDDYLNANNVRVKFYEYDSKKFCSLSDIDEKINILISNFLIKHNKISTTNIISEKACILSEQITRKIINNHSLVQKGQSQRTVAYENRIASDCLREILLNDSLYSMDIERIALETKHKFCNIVEQYLYRFSDEFSDEIIESLSKLLQCISTLNIVDMNNIHASLQPHRTKNSLNNDDVRNYLDIFLNISNEPVLLNLPHFSNKFKKYLPTALDLNISSHSYKYTMFMEDLQNSLKENVDLLNLIYEYNNLIASRITGEGVIITSYDSFTKPEEMVSNNEENNIVKPYNLRILSIKDSMEELNAK